MMDGLFLEAGSELLSPQPLQDSLLPLPRKVESNSRSLGLQLLFELNKRALRVKVRHEK